MIDPMEYKSRSYEDLSAEFKLSVSRAFELVPLMYNRLTLIDNLSHKAALTRMYNDHRHLPGFSERNIRRYLPLDNESVPRRVRPTWPKNTAYETLVSNRLSNTKKDNSISEEPNKDMLHVGFSVSRDGWWENFLRPVSRLKGDIFRVKVVLDKRTEMATIRIEE